GIEACAPIRVTDIDAASQPNCAASASVIPMASPAASAPLKQSPAAVVSIAFTGGGDRNVLDEPSERQTPLFPSVMMTLGIPRLCSASAACMAEGSSLTSIPVSNPASVSLGVIKKSPGRLSFGNAAAGAGLRITL